MRNQCVPLLPADVIVRAERLDVPLLLNGLKAAEIEIPGGGCMAMEIMPVKRGMKAVGTAMMAEMDSGDNFSIHTASYSVKGDGCVTVIDGKGYVGRACFGGLITRVYRAAGFKSIIIDNCTKDRGGNVGPGFPVYSRGFVPKGPIKKDKGDINTPITCDGVKVEPGNLVIDDSDGICVTPREHTETVLSGAERKLAYEENREKTIVACQKAKAEGGELLQLAPQWVLNMLQAE